MLFDDPKTTGGDDEENKDPVGGEDPVGPEAGNYKHEEGTEPGGEDAISNASL